MVYQQDMGYVVYSFCQEEILRLLGGGAFEVKHGTHLTWVFNIPLEGAEKLIPKTTIAEIVGYSINKTMGVEALVVSINGSYEKPFEEGFLHITGSTKKGVPPFLSNKMLKEQGWIDWKWGSPPCLKGKWKFMKWVKGSSPQNRIDPEEWNYNPKTRLFEKPKPA